MIKLSMILVGVFALNTWSLSAQKIASSDNFCHDEFQVLSCCRFGDFILDFAERTLKSFRTKDSSLLLDVKKKQLQLKARENDDLTIKIKSEYIEVYSLSKDTTITLSINDNSDLCKGGNTMQLMSFGKQVAQILYKDCKISALLFPTIHGKSVLIWFFSTTGSAELTWDLVVTSFSGKTVKLFSSKINGQPESIFLSNQTQVNADYKERNSGIEFVSAQEKSANKVYKIRSLEKTDYKDVFEYSDLITYRSNGKIKSTKLQISRCDCN